MQFNLQLGTFLVLNISGLKTKIYAKCMPNVCQMYAKCVSKVLNFLYTTMICQRTTLAKFQQFFLNINISCAEVYIRSLRLENCCFCGNDGNILDLLVQRFCQKETFIFKNLIKLVKARGL